MKKVYIIDYITPDNVDVEQYGKATYKLEDAKNLFAEAVKAYGLEDNWSGVSCIAEDPYTRASLVLRAIDLPAA